MKTAAKLDSQKVDLDQFILLEKKIIRIQAIVRGKLTLARLVRIVSENRSKIALQKGKDPEELALTEFAIQLKAKKLTPESFFRICDETQNQMITADQVKFNSKKLGLRLTDTQFRRLFLIFDEDFNGTISLTEYQNALEAYRVKAEKHINPLGGKFLSFEERTIEMLHGILDQKRLTPEQLFVSCDSDNSGIASIEEIKNMVAGMKPSVQLKELRMIHSFLDINHDGKVTRQEFLKRLAKELITFRGTGEFEEEEVHGDQAFASQQPRAPIKSSVKPSIKTKTVRPQTADGFKLDERTSAQIVSRIEFALRKQGITPEQAFKSADTRGTGTLTINELKVSIGKWLPDDQITPADLKLCMMALDVNRNGRIDESEFLQIMNAYRQAALTIEEPVKRPGTATKPTVEVIQNKPESQAGKSVDYSEFDISEVVQELEKLVQSPVEQVIFDYLTQVFIGTAQLVKLFQKPPNQQTPRALILQLALICDSENQKVNMSTLIRSLSKVPGKIDTRANIKRLATSVQEPVRQTLESQIIGYDDGVNIDEFTSAFQNSGLNKWELVCIFYSMAVQKNLEPLIEFEILVKTLSQGKGKTNTNQPVPAEKPVQKPPVNELVVVAEEEYKQKKATSILIFGDDKFTALLDQKVADRKTMFKKNRRSYEKLQEELNKLEALKLGNPQPNSPELLAVDPQVQTKGCFLTPVSLLEIMKEFWMVSDKIGDPTFINQFIGKSRNWLEMFSGDEAEGATKIVMETMTNEIKQNTKITHTNTLMIRVAFEQQRDSKGKPFFTFFECILVTLLFAQRDSFNTLNVDFEFTKDFMDQTDVMTENSMIELFQQNCLNRITQRLQLASYIITTQKWTENRQIEFKIFEENFWTCCRFALLITELIDCLTRPGLLEKFLEPFLKYENNCVTYFRFKHICDQIGLKPHQETEWVFYDLESHLDNQGLANIDLKEIEELLQLNGFSLNVKLKEGQQNKIEEQRKVGPTKYVLGPNDYFNGCQTMLNSEVAALKVAIQLYEQCLKDKQRFFDTDFGPKSEDDEEGKYKASYFEKKIQRGHPLPENMEWQRPSEFLSEGNGKFLVNDAGANDVKQGLLGDCWFIGALSVIATQDELIRGGGDYFNESTKYIVDEDIIHAASIGVYPPIFHKFRFEGIYVFRFYKNMKWRYVIIDERLPIMNNQLVYAHCTEEQELWVPLIEKAYAKLFGCYQALISGNIDDGLSDMTSKVCEKIDLHDKSGNWNHDSDTFWAYLLELKRYYSLMGCSRSAGGTENSVVIDGEDTGIISGHAYGIMDVFDLHDPEMQNPRKTHRILRIRNPWGKGEWCQKWSPSSSTEEIEKYRELIDKYISELQEEEKFDIDDEQDGTFLINYQNFRNIFDNFFAVVDFNDDWNAIRFDSRWDKDCAGGLPLDGSEAANIKFAKNPQYEIVVNEDTDFFISLSQLDGRVSKDGQFSKFPYKERSVVIMLMIFELPEGQAKLTQFVTPMYKTKPKLSNEVSLRLKLERGKRYVVVPSNKMGQESEFFLSIYFSGDLDQIHIHRLDRHENYHFIQEYYEKTHLQKTISWKRDWVVNNTLNYVIKQSDDNDKSASQIITEKTFALTPGDVSGDFCMVDDVQTVEFQAPKRPDMASSMPPGASMHEQQPPAQKQKRKLTLAQKRKCANHKANATAGVQYTGTSDNSEIL